MVWKKKTRKKRPRKSGAEYPYKIPAVVGAGLVCVCVAVVAVIMGLSALWRGITQMDEFRVDPLEITMHSSWVRPEVVKQDFRIHDKSGVLSRKWSIFTPDLARKVAVAYGRCPWVRRVWRVAKVFPNRLDIEIDLREPFAVVHCPSLRKYYCIDEQGVVLGKAVYVLTRERLKQLMPFLVVHNTQSIPKEAGVRWEDVAVQEGIKMIRLHRKQLSGKISVTSIEIKTGSDDGAAFASASLILENGTRIVWGHTPGAMKSVAEVSTQRKTATLLALADKEGPALGGHKVIDLRWRQPKVE